VELSKAQPAQRIAMPLKDFTHEPIGTEMGLYIKEWL